MEDEQILKAVRHHHEHYEGIGFPDRLSGEQISLGTKILAVANAYDVLMSECPHREAMSVETACDCIERCKGTQFDPEVADAFLRMSKSTNSV